MVKATQGPSQARRVFALLVGLFTLFFLLATTGTAISLLGVNDFLANAAHVNGQVVGLKSGAKGARAPIVQFKTTNGDTLQLQSNIYTSPSPNVGDSIKVVYRTSNPQDWQIDDWIHLYFWTLFGSIFMFAWGLAATITKLAGEHQIRKLESSEAGSTK